MAQQNEISDKYQKLKQEWLEVLDEFAEANDERKNEDLFGALNYLTFCDEFCTNIYNDTIELDLDLKYLESLKKSKKNAGPLDDLIVDLQEFKNEMQKKREQIEDEYQLLAESTLRGTQDLIARYLELMEQEPITPTLKSDINQNLEKDLLLRELKDTLESYRGAREDYISELEKGSKQQLHEDFGEETPEIDYVLSELDTAITECDNALLNRDITD